MRLFFKRKDDTLLENEELSERLQGFEQRSDFFLLVIRGLLFFLRDFSLDLEEIKTNDFKRQIDDLTEVFISENETKFLSSSFEKRKEDILAFIRKQKDYIQERESEYREIINLLSEAMAAFNSRNQDFNLAIYKHSEKVEKIILLNDIRKIKNILKQEIIHMREVVRKKELGDNKQLELLSEQVNSLKIQLEKAESKSQIDGLTGILNRKAFDLNIWNLVEKNTINKTPFSMLFLDIDNFKQINDAYGHRIGDRVILTLVGRCRKCIRKEDFFYRYGGEEFVIILPGASLRVASMRAKQICKSIAHTRYIFHDPDKEQALNFTVSLGVSSYRKGDNVASIIDRADKALYAAKRSGKNRVITEKEIRLR